MIKCSSPVSDCIFVDAVTDTLRLMRYDCVNSGGLYAKDIVVCDKHWRHSYSFILLQHICI